MKDFKELSGLMKSPKHGKLMMSPHAGHVSKAFSFNDEEAGEERKEQEEWMERRRSTVNIGGVYGKR